MQLTLQQQLDAIELEGRDLMYYILGLYEKSVIDGDSLTSFLSENISDAKVINYLEEEANV
tara:strand:- start:410 stop:592 length:183 start_codon:yes stop_codon:yes gene_type:complete